MEIPLLGQSNAQARQAQPEETEAAEPIDVTTAFYLLKDKEGDVQLVADLGITITTEREAHPHDTIGLCRMAQDQRFTWAPDVSYEGGTVEADTGILVYLLPHGEALADTNLDAPVVPEREPSGHEIIMMTENVMRDMDTVFHAGHIAQTVIQAQQQLARFAQQQMEQARIQQNLAGGQR